MCLTFPRSDRPKYPTSMAGLGTELGRTSEAEMENLCDGFRDQIEGV